MKRLRRRLSFLTAIWIAVGIMLFAVIWAAVAGKSGATDGVFGVGMLLFFVSGALFAGEVNLAIEAVNLRVDGLVRREGPR